MLDDCGAVEVGVLDLVALVIEQTADLDTLAHPDGPKEFHVSVRAHRTASEALAQCSWRVGVRVMCSHNRGVLVILNAVSDPGQLHRQLDRWDGLVTDQALHLHAETHGGF